MKRRAFIAGIGATAAWPLAVRAQQPGMPVVGFLGPGSLDTYVLYLAAFRKGLGESGFVEGQNVAIEYRWADGQYDRMVELAEDLARRFRGILISATNPHWAHDFGELLAGQIGDMGIDHPGNLLARFRWVLFQQLAEHLVLVLA